MVVSAEIYFGKTLMPVGILITPKVIGSGFWVQGSKVIRCRYP
jgi:hypothetical protein